MNKFQSSFHHQRRNSPAAACDIQLAARRLFPWQNYEAWMKIIRGYPDARIRRQANTPERYAVFCDVAASGVIACGAATG